MNAGDETQVKKAGDRDERIRVRRLVDLKAVMSTVQGRRVINDVIEFSGPLREAFNPNGSMTNFNLGRQSVGRMMFLQLDEACPDLFLTMRQEAKREVA